MGYRVKKHHTKRGWKLLFETFLNGKRSARGVPTSEWNAKGFRVDMTREEAANRAREINSQAELLRHEQRRNSIQDSKKTERLIALSFVPGELVAEFERDKIDLTRPKMRSYWKRACEILAEVRLEPKDWDDNAKRFYKAFTKRGMSPSYVRQVLPLLNAWGKFKAKKDGTFFAPIPTMKGGYYKDVAEAFFNKDTVKGNYESAPLTPEHLEWLLENQKPGKELKDSHYRWLALSIWFGLRPVEVDLLRKPSGHRTWWTEEHQGITVLWIYQTKLKGVHPDKRIKYIPCFLSEHQYALSLIGPDIKRPTPKAMKKIFSGTGITLYGGRKGFPPLMERYGQAFENYSRWLGHTSVARTYASYIDRHEVTWNKKKAA